MPQAEKTIYKNEAMCNDNLSFGALLKISFIFNTCSNNLSVFFSYNVIIRITHVSWV